MITLVDSGVDSGVDLGDRGFKEDIWIRLDSLGFVSSLRRTLVLLAR